MRKCTMAITVEVSDRAYEVLSMIKGQHTLVNMTLNVDGTVTISQTVEDEVEVELWQGSIWSDTELADAWKEINGVSSSNKFPF